MFKIIVLFINTMCYIVFITVIIYYCDIYCVFIFVLVSVEMRLIIFVRDGVQAYTLYP